MSPSEELIHNLMNQLTVANGKASRLTKQELPEKMRTDIEKMNKALNSAIEIASELRIELFQRPS